MTELGTHWVKTGRVDSRRRCAACNEKIRLGEPHPTETWPSRLRLTPEQIDLLLVAAADFRDLCIEAEEPESVVSYVDWLGGVARQSGVHPDHDGIEGEPFPLREAGLPLTIRRAAS